MSEAPNVTTLLLAWSRGEDTARDRLVELLYAELRVLARRHLRRERPEHSLTPTALVHEAYLRLIDQQRVHWQSRAHFFSIAGHVMRRILVDHARARATAKRNRGVTIAIDGVDVGTTPVDVDLIALDAALDKLTAVAPRQGQLVELRFFAGLTVEEIASALEIAPITVKRDWAHARAWLFRELRREPR